MKNQPGPIFIVGAQRSGTTLVRLMLNAHSKIAIPEEGTFFIPYFRRYRKNLNHKFTDRELDTCRDYILKNAQFKRWGLDENQCRSMIDHLDNPDLSTLIASVYGLYARQQGKKIWSDKTPSFFRMIPVIVELFPHAKFIHVIRDGRDLFLSWRKMDPTKSNTAVVAKEWAYKLSKCRNDLDLYAKGKFFEVRYEDLVRKPENVLKDITSFIGVAWEENMLSYWKTSEDYIGRHHSELIFKPPTTDSVGKWKNGLTDEEINIFETIAHGFLSQYNYETTVQAKERKRIKAYFSLCVGLPARTYQVTVTMAKLSFASKFGLKTSAAGGR